MPGRTKIKQRLTRNGLTPWLTATARVGSYGGWYRAKKAATIQLMNLTNLMFEMMGVRFGTF